MIIDQHLLSGTPIIFAIFVGWDFQIPGLDIVIGMELTCKYPLPLQPEMRSSFTNSQDSQIVGRNIHINLQCTQSKKIIQIIIAYSPQRFDRGHDTRHIRRSQVMLHVCGGSEAEGAP